MRLIWIFPVHSLPFMVFYSLNFSYFSNAVGERTTSQVVAITATYDGIMPCILFLHAINLLHTQSRKFKCSNKWKKVEQFSCFHPISLIHSTTFTPAEAPWTSLRIQLPKCNHTMSAKDAISIYVSHELKETSRKTLKLCLTVHQL